MNFRNVFVVAVGATSIFAACVLNGQPTPPEIEASNKPDATAIGSHEEVPTGDSKGFDASIDAATHFGDAADDALDAGSDVLDGGG